MNSPLQRLVVDRCKELGPEKAGEFFAVSVGLVRQWINGSKTPSLAAVERVYVAPDPAPKEASWDGREVFIAMPFYRSVSPRVMFSLLGVWDRAKFRGGLEFDNAILVDAREKLAADFLATDCPFIWWRDDDVIAPMGSAGWFNRYAEMQLPEEFAGIHTPSQLRSHGKSMVSGLYFGRRQDGRAMYHEALLRTPEGDEENRRAHSAPFRELKQTRWAGLGCMLHSRDVLLDIQKTHPHLAPQSAGEVFHYFSPASDPILRSLPEVKGKLAALQSKITQGEPVAPAELADLLRQIESAEQESRVVSTLRQGEDKTFGERAAAAGHPTFVDLSVVCGHIGEKSFNSQNTTS